MKITGLRNKCIGIFDSGFGGLDIMRGIVKELPEYNYIYLSDNARAPYGSRSGEMIYKFTEQGVDFLFKVGCEIIILACNTVSSEALRKIQQEYLPKNYPNKRVLGVLIPAAEEAVKMTKNNRIGVIATENTVNSGAFIREITKINPKIKLFQKSCPLLVPLIEVGEQNTKITELILKNYLSFLINRRIDTLILGCTHYSILENRIKKILGDHIKIISERKIIPRKLRVYFKNHPEIESELGKNNSILFYSTDVSSKFNSLGSKFFGRKIEAKKCILD